tara:strand:+ start:10931 stop:11098 length:168 start_codon:yes stop_codon:yes gene_type:complete
MTRKDFITLANIIVEQHKLSEARINDLILPAIVQIKAKHPNFDPIKFEKYILSKI